MRSKPRQFRFMIASRRMPRHVWLTCSWLLACGSMQNLGERDGSGTNLSKSGASGHGSVARSSGGAKAATGSAVPSGARVATDPHGGTSNLTIPTNPPGGTDGLGLGGACWETSDQTTMTLHACPSSYCEIRAQVVGYCGNYVANRMPPIVKYAYERSCSGVKDVSIEVAAYGYSCRYERNRLVGIMEYSDTYRYCSEQSQSIQSGVVLTACTTYKLTFCDARVVSVGAAGSASTTTGAAGAGNNQAMGGTVNSLAMAGGAAKVDAGAAGALGATGGTQGTSQDGTAGNPTQIPIGLCYDAATDTCQPC